jgi:phenylacetate-CoA ligase
MGGLLGESAETIRRFQDEKLKHMLALCRRGHPYYRRRWAEAGIDLSAIRGIADLHRLPLTPKQHLMSEPESFRLSCPDLPVYERTLWEVIHTTGTTSDPTPLYVTTHDYNGYLFLARRVAEISGITRDDVIANLFPLTQAAMGAYVRSAELAYAVGATICAGLTGARYGHWDNHRSLDEAVELLARHRVTVIWGLTSFVRRVLVRAQELKADVRSLRMCAVTGESTSKEMRDDMRERMRALGTRSQIIFDRYGTTESGGLAQCREEGDWHNPAPEMLYHETVDPQTGAPLPEGERGWLALTHLDHRGTVVNRYLPGDVVSVERGRCPHCGRTGERLVGPVVRTKDLIKVKGMLINPDVLISTLGALPGVREFQVVVMKQDPADPFSMDEIVVRIAMGDSQLATETLAAQVREATAAAVRVTPRVEFVAADAIFDPATQAKAARLVDRRPSSATVRS